MRPELLPLLYPRPQYPVHRLGKILQQRHLAGTPDWYRRPCRLPEMVNLDTRSILVGVFQSKIYLEMLNESV